MAGVTEINAAVDAAIAANEAGDRATAITKLETAAMILAGLPDQQQADAELKWDRAAIDRMLTYLRRLSGTSSGIQTTLLKPVLPS